MVFAFSLTYFTRHSTRRLIRGAAAGRVSFVFVAERFPLRAWTGLHALNAGELAAPRRPRSASAGSRRRALTLCLEPAALSPLALSLSARNVTPGSGVDFVADVSSHCGDSFSPWYLEVPVGPSLFSSFGTLQCSVR